MKTRIPSMRKVNPLWNKWGPPIPCWFRKKLETIDPNLVLQFVPPQCGLTKFKGVPPGVYPCGVWDICYRVPKTRYLHSVAVWSLADMNGRPSFPGTDTIKLLQTAVRLHRSRQTHKLEREMSFAIQRWNDARARASQEELHSAMQKYCGLYLGRQWQDRVIMRREVPNESSKSLP